MNSYSNNAYIFFPGWAVTAGKTFLGFARLYLSNTPYTERCWKHAVIAFYQL